MTLNNMPDWPKSRYDSRLNNIATEFFVRALQNSTTYRRLGGFFSSTSLALAARGIKELVKNEGKMQLVVSPILTKEDSDMLNDCTAEQRDGIINRSLLGEFDLADEFEKNHVAALAYLLKREFLEIRIEIPKDIEGRCLDYDSVMQKNMLDEKLGILQDREGNAISFRGPVNENRQNWEHGVFSITVDVDWIDGQKPHVLDDIDRFEKKWNDHNTLRLPRKTHDSIVANAPSDVQEIDLDKFNVPPWAMLSNGNILWDHQIRAVNSWMNSDYRGILSMATGGGKTLSALVSASLVPADSIVLILVPTKVLIDQWEKEIRLFDPGADLILCDSTHPTWNTILSGKLIPYVIGNPKRDKPLLVLSTMDTASGEKFRRGFEHIKKEFITMISDEVHHLGAPEYSKIFEINAQRRLGLSATFTRDWDEVGTRRILDYFGRQLDGEYTISDGIRDQKLSRYEYHPFLAYLDESEYDEYAGYTVSIGMLYARLSNTKDPVLRFELEKKYYKLLRDRAEIIKKTRDKLRAYSQILLTSPKKPYIVFADDHDQVAKLKEIHKDTIHQINLQRSDDLEKDDIMTFSGKLSDIERLKVLEESKSNKTPLFAMYCLDEGVDVPEFQSAILVSSSTSKRQYIQRRGRILRTSRQKVAHLYDIIVLPNPHSYPVDPDDARTIIRKEKERVNELARDAVNKWAAIGKIDERLRDLGFLP